MSFLARLRGGRSAPTGSARDLSFSDALAIAGVRRETREAAGKSDPRFRDGVIFPDFRPKFPLELVGGTTVFTIGSCFARNVEAALLPLGIDLPTRRFRVPKSEYGHRANGLLNEFNPGALSRRILDALRGEPSPDATIVANADGYVDLLLLSGTDVTLERARERRREIADVYAHLAGAAVTIVTLGLTECWYDRETERYLNRAPPFRFARSAPSRFEFRQLDVARSLDLLFPAFQALSETGTRVVLSVSPVPISTTFTDNDPLVADAYAKSVLRVCADELARAFANVDYFPSFEIVKSGGSASLIDDNVHVRDGLVKAITAWMVECYRSAPQRSAGGGVAQPA